MTDVDLLIVGGGIAGLSAAWQAKRAGRAVTLVDEGIHRASDLPIALINPLRGHTGRLVTDGIAGMQATFALIDNLRDAGHAIDSGRGLYRPLIEVVPEARHEAFWRAKLDGRLAFDWYDSAPEALGLVERMPCLRVHAAGWVAPHSLLDALTVASDATFVVDRVTRIARHGPRHVVALASGSTLTARSILWCGGAWGAALLDRQAATPSGDALYKPGSLLAVDTLLTATPLSFGLYAAPFEAKRTLIGPTREGSNATFPDEPVAPEVVAHLGDRIARVFGTTMTAREVWRGVRLTRLSSSATVALDGIPTLTALGSRGFLMAPLLAATWARSL